MRMLWGRVTTHHNGRITWACGIVRGPWVGGECRSVAEGWRCIQEVRDGKG